MSLYKNGCLLLAAQLLSAAAYTSQSVTSIYDWTGFYLGTKAGAAYTHSDTPTLAQTSSLFTAIQANSVNQSGQQQKIDTSGFLAGITGGYNWQVNDHYLLGWEVDLQSLSNNGMSLTNAQSYPNANTLFVITSYVNNNWLFTARPRLGLFSHNWLLYATGGLALSLLQNDFVFTTNTGIFEAQKVRLLKAGYVLGAGVERELNPKVSIKAEYLFSDFGTSNASLANQFNATGQTFINQTNLNTNTVTLGLNYHIDEHLAHPLPNTLFDSSKWRTQLGARLFLSSGIDGAPQPLLNTAGNDEFLASRLIFSVCQQSAKKSSLALIMTTVSLLKVI